MTIPNESTTFHVPALLDSGATFLWAMTGALVAVRRGCDIVGLAVVATVSALGGGLLRDGLFLQQIPVAVTSYLYLPLVACAVLVVAILRVRLEPFTRHRSVDLIDALGIGAFAVVGMDKAMAASFTPWGVILTGLVNALGGAILRDIFLNEVPTILRPSQFYALPVFAGCLLYLTAIHFTILNPTAAAWITVACVFLLRLLTIQFGWKTSPMLSQ